MILKKLFLLLILALFTASCQNYSGKEKPRVVKGVVDYTAWDFKADGPSKLIGDWSFYWKQHLTPDDFRIKDYKSKEAFIQYPKAWKDYEYFGEQISLQGYATYKVMMKFPKEKKKYRLSVYELLSGYKLYVDGEVAISFGKAGKDFSSSEPAGNTRYYTFVPKSENVEIVIQASNFYHRDGGTYQPIEIGLDDQMHTKQFLISAMDTFVIGCIIIMGLYHFFLFAFRRKNKAPLYFAICCLALGIRFSLSCDGDTMFHLFPDMPWQWTKRLEYIGFYIGIPAFAHFIYYLYPNESFKFLHITQWVVAAVFSGMTVFSQAIFFTDIIEYYQITCLIVILFLTFSISLALYRRQEGGFFILVGILVLFATVVNDIMLAHSANTIPISQFGLNFFLFAQSILLAMKFSNAFNQVEVSEVKIRRMNKELIEKERARTLFFHNTSHELRTPLNGIIGFIEILKLNRYGKLPDRIRGQLNKIGTLAESLKLQVNTILDLAKEKKGELKLVNCMISMDDIVTYTKTMAEGLKKGGGENFNIESEWHGGQEGTFVCDKEKIHVIIRNLLGNAFKFKDPDRDNAIKFYISFGANELKIMISDTGLGIPDSFREKMFTEFEQAAKDVSRSYEGTGLGLALVKKLLNLMGGTIEYESVVGRGTTFSVRIPPQLQIDASVAVKKKLEEEKKKNKEEAPEIAESLDDVEEYEFEESSDRAVPMNADKDYYILVVDDNEINLEVISETLMIHEYTVDIAEGGQEALDSLKNTERKPDMIILDLMMPVVSGEDVLRQIKADDSYQDIPVMLLTARASQDDKVFGLGLGADDYLAKPIENKELLLRVKNLLMRVDLARLTESYMYREKMAQMGELMGDMSHELKNIHQANSSDGRIEDIRVDRLLGRTKVTFNEWNSVIQSLHKNYVTFAEMNKRKDIFLKPGNISDQEKKVFAGIGRVLKKLDIEDANLKDLWDEILTIEPHAREDIENIFVLYESIKQKTIAGKRAYEVLMSILDYSRDDSTTECLMSNVVRDTSTLLSGKLRKAQVTFEADIDNCVVKASSSDLHQIAVNLVSNACHALQDIEKGSDRIVKVTQRDEGKHIVYMFEDNGSGIPEDNLEKVFERNFTTKGKDGSGIGLFVSQKLSNKNNGALSVTSQAGKTIFELKLLKR